MNEIIFTNARKWYDACESHGHLLTSLDDPKSLKLGYVCETCGDWFLLGIAAMRAVGGGGGLTTEERESIKTSSGRMALPITWMNGCVLVLEEW